MNDIYYEMARAYNSSLGKTKPNIIKEVKEKYPEIDICRLHDMCEAIDAYVDLYGE